MPRPKKHPEPSELVTIPCDYCGCHQQATHHPKICVPVHGWSADAFKPFTLLINARFCKDHINKFDFMRLLDEETQKAFKMIAGRNMPDFNRTFLVSIPLGAPEAQMLSTGVVQGHA